MKGCMVLQRRFAYLGHELAVLLREKGVDEFCGYVHLRDSYDFLKTQKDMKYSGLILDEDIQKRYKNETLDLTFLKDFEKRYGNVWKFIGVDRVVRYGQLVREYPHDASSYSYEEMLRMVQVYAKALIAFLDEEKPDFILAYQPGALGTVMLYAIAKERGIPILSIVPTVTRNRNVVSERYDRMTWVEKMYEEDLKKPLEEIKSYKEAKAYVEEFSDRPVVYSDVYKSLIKHGRLKQLDFLHPKHIRRTYSNVRLVLTDWNKNKETQTDYTTVRPFWYFFDRIVRKMRTIRGYDDLYDTFKKERPYAFYALSYEPELSILLLAPFNTEQIAIIRDLARSLPAGMYLYVKEHPQMTPYRTRSYYKEIKKIPNVKLLRPEMSSFEVMRNSRLVSTITGTVGWEASLFGKPVITFGEVFYNALSSVKYSATPDQLPALVGQQLASVPDQEEIIRFVAALFEDSAPCDLLKLWEKIDNLQEKRDGLKDFADLISKKIRLVTDHKK